MIFEKLDNMFKMPGFKMDMSFPKMHFPKFNAKDFAGGTASMSTTEFTCNNGKCKGKTVSGTFNSPIHSVK
eukprot:CAMPEP_0206245192 /NCGR_PEP_ID=MMETSP0047_2-20121206/18562_1 /ASSEMBLY_ACC=CAM_ASM_000192 /TAXON_ID=195065 /ORGANISM="Chroomonas mesostigmatica_cf, Strain CCMP1168" /LENGTH=70 /DNA_ID=CAMNT_0053670467 /DNA_START=58 /DNA_END=270 /DNA_ORIENTATION=+